MGHLKGKGIWTVKEDLEHALRMAPRIGARIILCEVSNQSAYDAKHASIYLRYLHDNPSLTPVAWFYLNLSRPKVEAEAIGRAFEDGFAAVVLDAGFATARRFKKAEKFVQRILEMNLDTSNIYLCGEAYLDTILNSYPYPTLAQVCRGGYMPRIYSQTASASRKRNAERVVADTYDQYAANKAALGYNAPPLPVLGASWDEQGRARMTEQELALWCQAVEVYQPKFVSLFRAGTVDTLAWSAFEELKIGEPAVMLGLAAEVKEVLIQPGDPGYQVTTYPPHVPGSGWILEFEDVEGHAVHVRNSTKSQAVAVSYRPNLPKKGRYSIEVFIPGTNATTRGAQYFIVHHPNGLRQEAHLVVNQYSYSDKWVLLGTYELDPQVFESGRVNLVDVTSDNSVKKIAFSAMRWRIADSAPPVHGGVGYDAPIGTTQERASAQVWPGNWIDATGYGVPYPNNPEIHTGADLNLNIPVHDSDRGSPVYAIADGVVAHAINIPGSWGGLIIIRHAPLADGTPVYSRYAHVEQIAVKKDDPVSRGQQIAVVGYYAPGQNYHLHFDISCTNILESYPGHWPGTNQPQVLLHYVDPRRFIQEHRPT